MYRGHLQQDVDMDEQAELQRLEQGQAAPDEQEPLHEASQHIQQGEGGGARASLPAAPTAPAVAEATTLVPRNRAGSSTSLVPRQRTTVLMQVQGLFCQLKGEDGTTEWLEKRLVCAADFLAAPGEASWVCKTPSTVHPCLQPRWSAQRMPFVCFCSTTSVRALSPSDSWHA
tara:strand:+ start:1147 stop:1662 length:516 start_codon:yes stop_codon:yes gene_type:complete